LIWKAIQAFYLCRSTRTCKSAMLTEHAKARVSFVSYAWIEQGTGLIERMVEKDHQEHT